MHIVPDNRVFYHRVGCYDVDGLGSLVWGEPLKHLYHKAAEESRVLASAKANHPWTLVMLIYQRHFLYNIFKYLKFACISHVYYLSISCFSRCCSSLLRGSPICRLIEAQVSAIESSLFSTLPFSRIVRPTHSTFDRSQSIFWR